ncbi:alpha/beta-hydrolase [Thelephora ganbajun]|uniref:Alpha/beta-hydrolase n=1 Tax=Thelephora ganbajun TaxID=370292 RepID=A0ACB6Z949_THEGA|nr:alpha/beta-hydrolase [Thelephora ganbajun]
MASMFSTSSLFFVLSAVICNRVFGAPAAPTSAGKTDLIWHSCDTFGVERPLPGLYCTHVEVPMDYHNNSAGTANLAVIKYTAVEPGKSKGSIFINPGGPGGTGTSAVPVLAELLSAIFDGQYDIVSWDPRGSASYYTFPGTVTCFGSLEEEVAFWRGTPITGFNVTVASNFTDKEVEDLYATLEYTKSKVSMYSKRCKWGPVGPYLQYIGTSSTVRDLVALADKIVGPGQPINYWGFSYGTILGFHFVNMFPDRVGRVIIDGVADPSVWGKVELMYSLLTDTEAVFLGFSNACASAGRDGCRLLTLLHKDATGEEVKRFIEDSHDLALEILLTRPDKAVVDPRQIKLVIFYTLYWPGIWSLITNQVIYPLIHNIHRSARAANITTGVTNLSKEEVQVNRKLLEKVLQQPPQSHSTTAIYAADSWASDNSTTKDVYDMIVKTSREVSPMFGPIWTPIGYMGYKWSTRSVEQLPPFRRQKLRNQILVMGNTADPITPIASARLVTELLGDQAVMVEQHGFGHTTLAESSSCTERIVADHIMRGILPQEKETKCEVDNPFGRLTALFSLEDEDLVPQFVVQHP